MQARRPALDLTKVYKQRILGDIHLWFTWFGEDPREQEPCLVLTSARRIGSGRPCVVQLDNLWRYNDPKFLLSTARTFAVDLGMSDDMANVHKVASIIHDHLDDLGMMPNRPDSDLTAAADAVLTDRETGRSFEMTIMDQL